MWQQRAATGSRCRLLLWEFHAKKRSGFSTFWTRTTTSAGSFIFKMRPAPAPARVFRLTDFRRLTFRSTPRSATFFSAASFRPRRHLPDVADLIRRLHHGLSRFAGEGGAEFRHVHYHAVDAVFSRRVWIGYRVHPLILGAIIFASPLRQADEKALIGREPVTVFQGHILGGVLPGDVGQNRSAKVGNVLAFGQLRIDVDIVNDDVLSILVHDAVGM